MTNEPLPIASVAELVPLSLNEIQSRRKLIDTVFNDMMKKGIHYGVVPGCGNKPALFQAGSQLLCSLFQLYPRFANDPEVRNLGFEHREYIIRCPLYHGGKLVAEGFGSCSTMESKYRWRDAKRKCPLCQSETVFNSKKDSGFFCWSKKGGCGAQFNSDDPAITDQKLGKVENPDLADQYNTVLKMAMKRAHAHATILALAIGDLVTQDVDEGDKGDDDIDPDAVPAPGSSVASPASSTPANGSSYTYDLRNVAPEKLTGFSNLLRAAGAKDSGKGVWVTKFPIATLKEYERTHGHN